MSSTLSFIILCAKCFRVVTANSGGAVLSCGDFLCQSCCSSSFINMASCPACGKDGVKSAFLNEHLPEEVTKNLTNTSKELESIHDVLSFQVKYYKQTMKRILTKLLKAEQEIDGYKRTIASLEKQLRDQNNYYSNISGGAAANKMATDRGQDTQPAGVALGKRSLRSSTESEDTSDGFQFRVTTPQFHPNEHLYRPNSNESYSADRQRAGYQAAPPPGLTHEGDVIQRSNSVVSSNFTTSSVSPRMTPSRLFPSVLNQRPLSGSRPVSGVRPYTTSSKIRSPHIPVIRSPLLAGSSSSAGSTSYISSNSNQA